MTSLRIHSRARVLPSMLRSTRPWAPPSTTLVRSISTTTPRCSPDYSQTQPTSRPLIGVQAALRPQSQPKRTIFSELSLSGRISIVTGAKRGIGLELAMALAEAGSKVYCVDLQDEPGDEFGRVKEYVESMRAGEGEGEGAIGSLNYLTADVTRQKEIWDAVEGVAEREGRLDIAFANAGILSEAGCLEYDGGEFQKIMDVNVNGVLFTAQAAGRQMAKFKTPGSIVLTASVSGSNTNQGPNGTAHPWIAYNTSKSAVLQMTRSLACELGSKGIRVNSISPGVILTSMTKAYLETVPSLKELWKSQNPLGRLAPTSDLRGVAVWLASDASSFCTGSDIKVTGGYHAW